MKNSCVTDVLLQMRRELDQEENDSDLSDFGLFLDFFGQLIIKKNKIEIKMKVILN